MMHIEDYGHDDADVRLTAAICPALDEFGKVTARFVRDPDGKIRWERDWRNNSYININVPDYLIAAPDEILLEVGLHVRDLIHAKKMIDTPHKQKVKVWLHRNDPVGCE